MLVNKYYSIIKNTAFYGVLLFGLGVIFCIHMEYAEPLMFLNIAKSANELNQPVFEVFLKIASLIVITEFFYVSLYVHIMSSIKFEHIYSIILAMICFCVDENWFSTHNYFILNLLSALWFVLKGFSVFERYSYLNSYVCKKYKLSEITNFNINFNYFVLAAAIFIMFVHVIDVQKNIESMDVYQRLDLILKDLGGIILLLCCFVFLITSIKGLNVTTKNISYEGSFDKLVEHLFNSSVHLNKRVDNHVIFKRTILFFITFTIIAKEENNQITLTGNEWIMKLLKKDLKRQVA